MFSNFVIALIAGGSIGTWIFAKFQRSTGGNNKSAVIAAGVTALFITIVGTIVLGIFIKK